ncbi:MAG TPA: inositol monophosphatase family protein [Rhodopila sp.]|nr:inositol monophosphatase family protein [Rhodopila sp.]
MSPVLPDVIALVRQAGRMVADEFCRPDGPRSANADSAPVDEEVELFLRAGLTRLLPARFVGEESGVQANVANGYCWVVDPHDGTRAFLEGRRGSAVSVALLRSGRPVLGVVYAPLSPDRGPDLIAWAEGGPILRNGAPIAIDLRARELSPSDVVFLNHGSWQRPVWNGSACAPARFMPLPSIAYRLARVAAGDGIATVTLRPVAAHDIAAGHALLAAAGGVLLKEDGTPVTYDEAGDNRPGACFGGAPAAVATLLTRSWRRSPDPLQPARVTLSFPRAAEGTRLDRAIGCLLGLVIGDALGGQTAHPTVPRMRDDPGRGTIAGQPGAAGELAITLARTLAGRDSYDAEAAIDAYARWYESGPVDGEDTLAPSLKAASAATADRAHAARCAADPAARDCTALARIAPIGVWATSPEAAAAAAIADASLTHPHPLCQTACAALAAAIAAAVQGADRAAMREAAVRSAADEPLVIKALHAPEDIQRGGALVALANAFRRLAEGLTAEQALAEATAHGAADAAMTGAVLGAADGRAALPVAWVMPVLTCRPDAGLHAPRSRPALYWPDDLLDLTEALLVKPAA